MSRPKKKLTKSNRQDTGTIETKEQQYKQQAQDLRARNKQLSRENARLRKELRRVENRIEEHELVHEIPEVVQRSIEEVSTSVETCNKCRKHNVDIIPAGIVDVLVCQDCGSRKTRRKNYGS